LLESYQSSFIGLEARVLAARALIVSESGSQSLLQLPPNDSEDLVTKFLTEVDNISDIPISVPQTNGLLYDLVASPSLTLILAILREGATVIHEVIDLLAEDNDESANYNTLSELGEQGQSK
jgi:hypothetical protein